MKFPFSWLKEWVDLSDIEPRTVAKALTVGGIEVDKFAPAPLNFEGVVVGEIISAEQHPDAERLRIATVSDGKETFQVVCAASNCRAGIKTAFAKVGAKITQGDQVIKIKKGKLRGAESFGMLCASDELGLSDSADGIMELDAPVGIDLAEFYGDIIFEVTLTPNLGHCTSIMGIARELSALLERPFLSKSFKVTEDASFKPDIAVSIQDSQHCYAYACRRIKNVKIGPSPDWIRKRLEACGIRSINNVVDVTNYVMLERGQPLHAFDTTKIEGQEIRVRSDLHGKELQTLDGETRALDEETLLICDSQQPIAIAGIMGGANSEVSDQTTDILLEAAVFDGPTIRKTSKRLSLRTESSARFEKGVDPSGLEAALDRAAELINGQTAQGIVCQTKKEIKPREIRCRLKRINQILGTHLSLGDVEQIFSGLQFHARGDSDDQLLVTVPTFRNDISCEIDLIEEVGRIYGFENIEKRQTYIPPSLTPPSKIHALCKRARKLLQNEGLLEFITCDLIGPNDMHLIDQKDACIHVLHPSSIDQSILRPSLLPSMMQSLQHNFDHQNRHVSAFEIGQIHYREQENFGEQSAAAIALTGHMTPHSIDPKPRDVDFFDLKGMVENLMMGLDITPLCFEPSQNPLFHPKRQAKLIHGDFNLGILGQVHPGLTHFPIYFAQINLTECLNLWSSHNDKQMKPIPLYPGSDRDLTLTVDEEVPVAAIFDQIKKTRSSLLEDVYLLDLYRGGDSGKKNVTLRFSYRHSKKTLPAEAVDKEHARLVKQITV